MFSQCPRIRPMAWRTSGSPRKCCTCPVTKLLNSCLRLTFFPPSSLIDSTAGKVSKNGPLQKKGIKREKRSQTSSRHEAGAPRAVGWVGQARQQPNIPVFWGREGDQQLSAVKHTWKQTTHSSSRQIAETNVHQRIKPVSFIDSERAFFGALIRKKARSTASERASVKRTWG